MNGRKGKLCKWLVALNAACYFVSYVTRINYGAVILEIERAEGISKVAASMAVTGSFITYGAGQLISGWMGDRMKPDRLIFSGLLISAFMNVLVPVFAKPGPILIFWCVNGFAQALMWPPMVKLLSHYLDDEQYKAACVRVTWGSAAGTIAIYLLAPVCIMWRGWKSLFFLCAGTAFCFALIWNRGISSIEKQLDRMAGEPDAALQQKRNAPAAAEKGTASWGKGTVPLLAAIMLAIVMQGTLRDGITTWMPSYVSETYHLDSSSSILSGVLLPVFSIICLEFTSILNRKVIRNEMLCAGTVFGAGFCSALLLAFLPAFHVGVSVLLAALITGCMYGVNVILVSMVPPYFKRSGNVSTVSGLLNACTYVGSALSSYGFARAAQQSGWNTVIWLWAAAAFLGTFFCLENRRKWGSFIRNAQEDGCS